MNKPLLHLAAGLAVLAPIPAGAVATFATGALGIAAATASLAIGIAAALILRRNGSIAAPTEAAEPNLYLRRLRHDLRGALSPALLTTDRLLASPDAATQRSGAVIAESIERAITLIREARG